MNKITSHLSSIPITNPDTDSDESLPLIKIKISLEQFKALRYAVGDNITLNDAVLEINTLKRTDQELGLVKTALEGVFSNSDPDKINNLKIAYKERDDAHMALNVPSSDKAKETIKELMIERDENHQIHEVLGSVKGEAVTMIHQLKSTNTEHSKIHEALGSGKGEAVSDSTGLKKIETEHGQIYKAIGVVATGTAVAKTHDLNKTKTEHEQIYQALGDIPANTAVTEIGNLNKTKTENAKVYEALGANKDEAVAVITDLSKTKTEHGQIYEALGGIPANKGVAEIVDLKKIKTEHEQIEIEQVLQPLDNVTVLDAIQNLRAEDELGKVTKAVIGALPDDFEAVQHSYDCVQLHNERLGSANLLEAIDTRQRQIDTLEGHIRTLGDPDDVSSTIQDLLAAKDAFTKMKNKLRAADETTDDVLSRIEGLQNRETRGSSKIISNEILRLRDEISGLNNLLQALLQALRGLITSDASLVDEFQAFNTARVIELIIRRSSQLEMGSSQIFQLIALWRQRHVVVSERLLLAAYAEWFESFDSQPSTLPHVLNSLYQDETTTPRLQEYGATATRTLYCNVLTGYHLLVDGNTLVFAEESSLRLDLRHGVIIFPGDQIQPFTTNSPFRRLNPMIDLHMPGFWSRGTR
ncbi:hypothetical protein KCU78_g2784, partial [Aureobasidium melanogenum]